MARDGSIEAVRGLVQRYFELVTKRDWTELSAFFAPNATLTHPASPPMTGWAAMAPFYGSLPELFPTYNEYAENIIVEGQRAAAELVFEATRASGESLTLHASDFFEFEGERIRSLTIYLDTGALQG